MAFISSMFLFLLLAHLFLTAKVAGQAYTGNITLSGHTLSPSGPYSYLTSPSGEFAFGFRSIESNSSLFLLAIWFNKTSTSQPITWFAQNSSNKAAAVLAPAGSTLSLTRTGQLILAGPNSEKIWSPVSSEATHLALLEQGNLILYDSTESVLWQSFNSPTDTLVPGQSLPMGSAFQSKLTDTDFSPGRFELGADPEGYLTLTLVVQPSTTVPQYTDSVLQDRKPLWQSNNSSGTNLVFNLSGLLSYTLVNSSSPFIISQYPTQRYYQHATLDPDGVFRVYVYDKNLSDKGVWSTVQALPDINACKMKVDVGSGMCGYNAYCIQSSNSNLRRLNCLCPESYTFLDTSRPYLGCRPNFALQNCSADEATDFKIVEMEDADWWGAGDYMHFVTTDEGDCRRSCLSDCFCSVAIYRNTDCWKKKWPLSNGKQGTNEGGKALIKVRVSGGTSAPVPGSFTKKNRTDLVIAGAVMLGASLLIVIITAAVTSLYLLPSKRGHERKQVDLSPMGMNMKIFSYKDLDDATRGFAEELGRGAFGIVYKGFVKLEDHPVPVAVKKLDRLLKDGDREFINEVQSIGQIHHKNLVKLFGYCNEGPYKMLVYEYMSNGCLTNFIFGTAKLEWNIRSQIAIGVAQGLCYLHEGCSSQIIHCDIKPHNILLDDSHVPRISDFGLAKLLGVDQTRAATSNIRGTKGYFAPEWFKNIGITPKMDVYSFGVMLLEIVCCKRNIEQVDEEEIVLPYWAHDCFTDGRIDLLVLGDEEAKADIGRVECFLRIAIWCIQENPTIRPTMHKVAQMLEGAVPVAPPPDPSSYI